MDRDSKLKRFFGEEPPSLVQEAVLPPQPVHLSSVHRLGNFFGEIPPVQVQMPANQADSELLGATPTTEQRSKAADFFGEDIPAGSIRLQAPLTDPLNAEKAQRIFGEAVPLPAPALSSSQLRASRFFGETVPADVASVEPQDNSGKLRQFFGEQPPEAEVREEEEEQDSKQQRFFGEPVPAPTVIPVEPQDNTQKLQQFFGELPPDAERQKPPKATPLTKFFGERVPDRRDLDPRPPTLVQSNTEKLVDFFGEQIPTGVDGRTHSQIKIHDFFGADPPPDLLSPSPKPAASFQTPSPDNLRAGSVAQLASIWDARGRKQA